MKQFDENLRCCLTLPSRKWPFQIVKYVKKVSFRISLAYHHYVKPEQLNDCLVTQKILKFTESTIAKSSGNIAYNRKFLKTSVKSLKNACYGINFCKICEKQACNLTKI